MENSLSSPPPSYNALHTLTNPVHQQCSFNHSSGVHINPRLKAKANPPRPSLLPADTSGSHVNLELAAESFHNFNPSDSGSHLHQGTNHIFPKSRSHCHHPICSWWRWRGKEEEHEKRLRQEVIVWIQPTFCSSNLARALPGCSRDSLAFSLMILAWLALGLWIWLELEI